MNKRYHIKVSGIVQGVGFRPFVFGLAEEYALTGWVFNHAAGVSIEIQGEEAACRSFLRDLQEKQPPLARVDGVRMEEIPLETGESDFFIRGSQSGERNTLISPDMGICPDCLREMQTPEERRYGYAFTNCTNCGPRFTIIENLPYDRPMTTMKGFPLCEDCSREYENPRDRRFHAQPIACPACGPQLAFLDKQGETVDGDPIALAQTALRRGEILAVKGLGGYHLVCDARNEEAVSTLRQRKYRWDKPFAVMMENIEITRQYCLLQDAEEALVRSQRSPIVLLRKRSVASLAPSLAPGNGRLGVMLPYTPLHVLLLAGMGALVMTSGNLSDEPIVFQDEEVVERLSSIADGFLTHNRPIFRRCDDSLLVYAAGAGRLLRRSRGYAPEPLALPDCGNTILACGAEQKNCFCLTRGEQAFLSQHIGDMHNLATLDSFKQEIEYFQKMFQIQPKVLAYDLHPDYLASRYALERKDVQRKIPVQHHHAHFASVLAEHDYRGQAIGLIFDGTGYGLDGTIWGGEVFLGDSREYRRFAHLLPLGLPGGERAIREPWRLALAAAQAALKKEELERLLPDCIKRPGWQMLLQTMEKGVNLTRSSGMGRLFDAAAALAGVGCLTNYEGQAAVEFEQKISSLPEGERAYSFLLREQSERPLHIDWRPLVREELADLAAGVDVSRISARFHLAVAELCLQLCQIIREKEGLNVVALSGGCWQNVTLLEKTVGLLGKSGFQVLLNEKVPCNDGGIAYGQAAVAAARM